MSVDVVRYFNITCSSSFIKLSDLLCFESCKLDILRFSTSVSTRLVTHSAAFIVRAMIRATTTPGASQILTTLSWSTSQIRSRPFSSHICWTSPWDLSSFFHRRRWLRVSLITADLLGKRQQETILLLYPTHPGFPAFIFEHVITSLN